MFKIGQNYREGMVKFPNNEKPTHKFVDRKTGEVYTFELCGKIVYRAGMEVAYFRAERVSNGVSINKVPRALQLNVGELR